MWAKNLILALPNEIVNLIAQEPEVKFYDYLYIRDILLKWLQWKNLESFSVVIKRDQKIRGKIFTLKLEIILRVESLN